MIHRLFILFRMPFGFFGIFIGLALAGILLIPTTIQWVLTGNDSICNSAMTILEKSSDWLFLG